MRFKSLLIFVCIQGRINIDYWYTANTSVNNNNSLLEIKYIKEIILVNNLYLSLLLFIQNTGVLSLTTVATTHFLSITAPK